MKKVARLKAGVQIMKHNSLIRIIYVRRILMCTYLNVTFYLSVGVIYGSEANYYRNKSSIYFHV